MPEELRAEVKAPPQAESKPASKSEGWWQTMPGMLTAAAGILTALTGLLVALHQVGLLGGKEKPAPQPSPPATSQALNDTTKPSASAATPEAASAIAATAASTAAAASNNMKYSVIFPSGAEVKFRNNRGRGTYKILAAQVERLGGEKLVLKFTIRLTNNGPSDVGFWSDSFRLLLDGVPRAPVSRLIDAVEARSAKESDVEFEAPDTANSLALQVLVGDKNETADIPITLIKGAKL